MTTATQTHTPGPWKQFETRTGEPHPWNEGAADYERAILANDNIKIAVMEQWHPDLEAEANANAALIAAAPDLLAALEAVLATSQGPTKMQIESEADYEAALIAYHQAVDAGVDAIRKAKGQ